MENMKFFLTFAFIVDHCFAVCTFEVRWPDFDIDLFLCVNFLFLKGNQTIDQFSGAEGETCANWQVCNGVHPLCLCPGQVSQLARGSGNLTNDQWLRKPSSVSASSHSNVSGVSSLLSHSWYKSTLNMSVIKSFLPSGLTAVSDAQLGPSSFNSSPQCKKSSLRYHFSRNSWKLGSQKLLPHGHFWWGSKFFFFSLPSGPRGMFEPNSHK